MLIPVLTLILLTPEGPPVRTLRSGDATLELRGGAVEKETFVIPYNGLLRMTVRVEGGAGLEVSGLAVEFDHKTWNLYRQEPERRETTAPDRQEWSKTYHLDPQGPGDQTLPTVRLKYREKGAERWIPVEWTGQSARVAGIDSVKEDEVKGAPRIEQVPEPPVVRSNWLPHASAAAALLTALTLVVVWRYTRKAPPAPTAEQKTMGEIAALERESPSAGAAPDWFHNRLSAILRRYCEESYALPASRRTTEEFLAALASEGQMTEDGRRSLRVLLESCDLSKFARRTPPPERRAEELELARRFVQLTSLPQPSPHSGTAPSSQTEVAS